MQTFAEYILAEEDFTKKVEIILHYQNKLEIFFDSSVIFKAMLTKMFIETMELNVDKNEMITAALLYACKKNNEAQSLEKVQEYCKESAYFLQKLGFSDKFCKMCLGHNRYFDNPNREKESDILELVDQFGGMLLDRPERRGFPLEEAIVLLEFRNLKGVNNVYLQQFKKFIEIEKEIII